MSLLMVRQTAPCSHSLSLKLSMQLIHQALPVGSWSKILHRCRQEIGMDVDTLVQQKRPWHQIYMYSQFILSFFHQLLLNEINYSYYMGWLIAAVHVWLENEFFNCRTNFWLVYLAKLIGKSMIRFKRTWSDSQFNHNLYFKSLILKSHSWLSPHIRHSFFGVTKLYLVPSTQLSV